MERGFSVNRQILVENMKEDSFVGQRLVLDFIRDSGGIHIIVVKKELLLSTAQGRSKYEAYLREQREGWQPETKRKTEDSAGGINRTEKDETTGY